MGSAEQTYVATGVYPYTSIPSTSSTAYWIFVCNGCDGTRSLKLAPVILQFTNPIGVTFMGTVNIQYWQTVDGGGPRVWSDILPGNQINAANISVIYDQAAILSLGYASSLSTGGVGITNINFMVVNQIIYGNPNFIPGWLPYADRPKAFGYATDATKIAFLGSYIGGAATSISGYYFSETQGELEYPCQYYITVRNNSYRLKVSYF